MLTNLLINDCKQVGAFDYAFVKIDATHTSPYTSAPRSLNEVSCAVYVSTTNLLATIVATDALNLIPADMAPRLSRDECSYLNLRSYDGRTGHYKAYHEPQQNGAANEEQKNQ
jgi:hypothetical protein